MAWGVVWRVERISPYVGIRMGGIGWMELWRASDWLRNDKKQLKVKQSRQTQVYLGFKEAKTGTMSSGPMAGLVGRVFT